MESRQSGHFAGVENGWRGMQNAGGVGTDVPSELADLRGVPLHEMPAGVPVAVDIALQRVLPAAPVAVVTPIATFSSCI